MAVIPSPLVAIADRLQDLGFKKRAGAVFTVDVADATLGWLGLNTASRHQPPGRVEVNPVVGIRHQDIERIVAELRGDRFHPYLPPTVNTPLGYLMPGSRYKAWLLDTSDVAGEDNLVRAVAAYGLSFMRSGATLAEIRRLLDEGLGFDHQLVYRRPVALAITGDIAGSLQSIEAIEVELGDRNDAAAAQLRSFAAAFRRRYDVKRAY